MRYPPLTSRLRLEDPQGTPRVDANILTGQLDGEAPYRASGEGRMGKRTFGHCVWFLPHYLRVSCLAIMVSGCGQSVPDRLQQLHNKDPQVRKQAAKSLGTRGPNAQIAIPALIAALNDQDESVRQAVISALGQIGSAAVPLLIDALRHENPRIREGAVYALIGTGAVAQTIVPALTKSLNDRDHHVREAAAYALGRIGPEAKAATPVLIQALKDQDKIVRRVAAHALGQIGPPAQASVPALRMIILTGNARMVRTEAAEALQKINPEAATKAGVISRDQAVKIASRDAGIGIVKGPRRSRITAYPWVDGWHVDFEVIPHRGEKILGGEMHYVIDPVGGRILIRKGIQ